MKLTTILGWNFAKAALILGAFAATFSAQNANGAETAAKIRVLVLDGGHPYDEPAFAETLDALGERFEFERARLPEARSLLMPGLDAKYDVLLFYDMCQVPATDEEYADFVALMTGGKIGAFYLHHHFSAHPERADFWKLGGGCYVFEQNRVVNGAERPLGFYEIGVKIDVKPTKTPEESPFALEAFEIVDEIYYNPYVAPGADVLLTGTAEKGTVPLAWTWREHGCSAFVLLLGHDAQAYRNPAFRRLLANGLIWASENRSTEQTLSDK